MPWTLPMSPITKNTASWVQVQGLCSPCLLNQQMNLESSLSVTGPKDLQGLIGLFA